MKNENKTVANATVSGIYAPTAKVTLGAVFLIALVLSVPVFVGLTVADWIW